MIRSDHVKRLCIFAHFDKDDMVDDYVLFYLRDIRKVADKIVFVSASLLVPEIMSALNTICDSIIIRNNEGYDFASWQAVLKSEQMNDYDELILCNDSVYGPLFPLDRVFHEMERENGDFWGMTSNHDISYHIQSYFLVFRKNVLDSRVFQDFWKKMEIPQSKKDVIRLCEIGLSQILLSAGFKASVYTECRPFDRARLLIFHIVHSIRNHLLIRLRSLFASVAADRRDVKQRLRRRLNAFGARLMIAPVRLVSGMMHFLRRGPDGMIAFIRTSGKLLSSMLSYFNNKTKSLNVTHFFWKQLVLYHKMPFIKIDLLRDNPVGVNIRDYPEVISRVSNYNVLLIITHLNRVGTGSREIEGGLP